ncbi:MAG: dihydroorotate dehydrogenase electron transfer subunit [Clostridium sp.]|uniref:dihydroorotate dehydrogenase electron transfer subunit n=1 Tax=Clostridium sp. DSM 8431 TaxID=1761781 RepID=UPI0008F1C111|nr:dihydroorotate dehydrogenase electron transfer subunit [Clostridium sp. DSM 8431]MCR4944280.1 dihydroorotate dehydrogenase electron transfer subunit [Clostridium sp.]SFU72334.1 dihydroorotate dehydrogenase electron transfer subunit [Clostridium sp. DSM 8431]
MSLTYRESKIISNEKVIDNIYKMVCTDTNEVKPGQFYMLKKEGSTTLLPRPISVCEKEDGTVTFMYAVVGKGTEEFSKMKAGEEISLTGPLGNGFNLENLGKTAIVAGGIGTAPMVEVAKRLREKNKDAVIDVYAGYRDNIFLTEEYEKYASSVQITTNTGKHGHKGFVTEILKPEEYDTVLCCGPEVMMKAVVDMCKEKGTKIFVSMEKHMACGVGACLVCTCKTKDGNKRTCKDGPVFDGYYVEL